MADPLDLTGGPSTKTFPPHPDGTMPILCVDVIDFGEKLDTWQGKTKLVREAKYAFVTGERREDGKPWVLYTRGFTIPGMGDKGNHRKFLESWRGRPFTEAELPNADTGNPGPDVTKLVGVGGIGTITHKPRKGGEGVYTNLVSVIPLMKGMAIPEEALAAAKDYVRGDWVQDVRARYAEEVAAWKAANAKGTIMAAKTPKALTDALDLETMDDDTLPF